MSAKTYPEITIYALYEDSRGAIVLGTATGTVHGSQVWTVGNSLGPAFGHARRIDRASVHETPEAAVAHFAKHRRARAEDLRRSAARLELEAHEAEALLLDGVKCMLEDGVVVDPNRDRVLAYLRAAPRRDRTGQHYYPAVDEKIAVSLQEEGIVRLVDWGCGGGGYWLVDLLEIER